MTNIIKITTQAEWDTLPDKFNEFTEIQIYGKIEIKTARDNSQVTAWDNSQVTARDNSQVTAWDNSQVTAWDDSQVTVWNSSQVTALGNSRVTAWENNRVTAWGNSQVTVRDNSQVTARDNSQVTAWDNSQVTAWDDSQVTAWGNSQVTAWGNSQVTAQGNVALHNHSEWTTLILFGFSVCWLIKTTKKITRKNKSALVIEPKKPQTTNEWLKTQGINKNGDKIILFKRVSEDFKTQETTPNETTWKINETITHQNWSPKQKECGEGKFHACSYPYFCDKFRDKKNDKYIAIEILIKDLFVWKNPKYPYKIAFRKGKVLYECNTFGQKI